MKISCSNVTHGFQCKKIEVRYLVKAEVMLILSIARLGIRISCKHKDAKLNCQISEKVK